MFTAARVAVKFARADLNCAAKIHRMRSHKLRSGRTILQEIRIHAGAPRKPATGAACNGCGACCAAEPCPVSRVLLGHRDGPCPALTWMPDERRYFCGMVIAPARHLPSLPTPLANLASRLFRRWIAAGSGCDFDAEVD